MDDEGRHGENIRMLERLLETEPSNPDLHLLLARTFSALDRREDSRSALQRAAGCGENDADVLTQVASMAFYAGEVEAARRCIDRAKKIAPRQFVLNEDLKELDRNVRRRDEGLEAESRLSSLFGSDPGRPGVAADLARHLERNGQTYAAYHAVARGLHYRPDDRSLLRLEKELGRAVPDDVRAEAERWAASDEPFAVSEARPD